MRSVVASFIMTVFLCLQVGAETVPAPTAQFSQTETQVPTGPHRVRGTIASFDGRLLTVRSDVGETVAANVLPTTICLYNEPRTVSDIHSGDFLGSAAVPGSDGKLHAQDVVLFPEQLRGMGEGQYPMGTSDSNRSMTNATVAEVTSVAKGGTLKLRYHGAGAPGDPACTGHAAKDGNGCVGQTEIVVAPGVPVLAYVIGDTSSLVRGAAVSMVVATGPDGTAFTPRVLVEHNGVKPI